MLCRQTLCFVGLFFTELRLFLHLYGVSEVAFRMQDKLLSEHLYYRGILHAIRVKQMRLQLLGQKQTTFVFNIFFLLRTSKKTKKNFKFSQK